MTVGRAWTRTHDGLGKLCKNVSENFNPLIYVKQQQLNSEQIRRICRLQNKCDIKHKTEQEYEEPTFIIQLSIFCLFCYNFNKLRIL